MNIKRFFSAAVAASLLLTVTGCGGSVSSVQDNSSVTESTSAADDSTAAEGTSSDSTSATDSTPAESTAATTSAPEAEPDYSTLSEAEIYDLMVKRSLMTTGDMTRMANVLKRAQNGEEITAAYIGGSITEGYHDNLTLEEDQKWAKMSTTWLNEQFPSATVNYVNAGISGTPSVLGNVRLERDVLNYDPDIVFVEFAVNDGAETIYKNAYESLVRTLLADERDIAVVLIFTFIENGHTCQPHMSKIGENYNLPMISLPDSIKAEMDAGRMVWRDYSGDGSHPHVEGSKMILDLVKYYYENVIPYIDENVGEVDNTLPEPIFSGDYMNMDFMDNTELKPELTGFVEGDVHGRFNNGWQYRGDTGATMKFDITCKKLAMVFKANNSKMYGDAQVYVDGELTTTISSNMGDGWNNPVTAYIYDGDESASHTVEIKVDGKAYFGIMAFGASN